MAQDKVAASDVKAEAQWSADFIDMISKLTKDQLLSFFKELRKISK